MIYDESESKSNGPKKICLLTDSFSLIFRFRHASLTEWKKKKKEVPMSIKSCILETWVSLQTKRHEINNTIISQPILLLICLIIICLWGIWWKPFDSQKSQNYFILFWRKAKITKFEKTNFKKKTNFPVNLWFSLDEINFKLIII